MEKDEEVFFAEKSTRVGNQVYTYKIYHKPKKTAMRTIKEGLSRIVQDCRSRAMKASDCSISEKYKEYSLFSSFSMFLCDELLIFAC